MVERRQRFGKMSVVESDLLKSILLDQLNENLVSVGINDQRTNIVAELHPVNDYKGPSMWEPHHRVIEHLLR